MGVLYGAPKREAMTSDNRQFRIIVWRPVDPMRNLMVLPAAASGTETDSDCASYEFHEQVYAWEPKGVDVWGSVRNSDDTQNLRVLLLETFNPSPASPVSRRRIGKLESILNALEKVLANKGSLDWADSEDIIDSTQPESQNVRANTIAVLYNHLRWIYEVFREVPGASVSVR